MDILCKFMYGTQLFVETADLSIEGKNAEQKLETLLSFKKT